MSYLRELLRSNKFVVTAECGPPKGADPEVIRDKAKLLKEAVDAVNVTDNQTAMVRMSSLASCVILKEMGIEPVLQVTVRDRNRIALQSDILGASALGIENVLCLSGDHPSFGDHPDAIGVFDLDSVQLIQTLRIMRDEGRLLGGNPLTRPPSLFIGAVENPFGDPFEFRPIRLQKKVKAGAQFIQTQCVFDTERFEAFVSSCEKMGLLDQVSIIAGVTPLKSYNMAKYMATKVSGITIPEEILKRMGSVSKDRQREEGISICVETIEKIKKIPGVRGVHIMAIEWEEAVPEIVKRAGLKNKEIT